MVAGRPLYADEVRQALRRMSPIAAGPRVKQRALDSVIDQRLLLDAAERAAVVVSTDEVDATYQMAKRGFGADAVAFAATLQESDQTESEFRRALRDRITVSRFLETRVYARIAVTDAEIDAYSSEHPELAAEKTVVAAHQILLQSQEEALRVLREIQRGMSFADAAMRFSLSPEGHGGGRLPAFSPGEMPAVYDACFTLPVGRPSGPIASDYGYHLFLVQDRTKAGPPAPERVRALAETALRRSRERAAEASTLADLRANVTLSEEALALLD
jgi:peptidyl-prolyl cis-trans isomerase C